MAWEGSTFHRVADDMALSLGPDALRRVAPLPAVVASAGALVVDPGTPAENIAAVAAVIPFVVWAWWGMPTVLLVSLVAAVELFALGSGRLEPLLFLLPVAATAVGGWEPSRMAVVVAGLLAAATPVAVQAVHGYDTLYPVWVMGVLFPLALCRGFRWQLGMVSQLAEARQEIARQAVLDEKRRIARDVHDLVGHGLATVLLHVTGARHVLHRDVDAADEALADAEAVGRRSMQELRRTIGMLRSPDPGVANVAPLPGASDLLDVVEAASAAGVDVDFRSEGDLGRIDPVLGVTLYRVAEEALTNVRRHGPRAVTDVLLVVEEDTAVLTVDSIGPVGTADSEDPARPRYGIVGMRERMATVGGELEAGPTTTGWLVRCRAPLATADVGGSAGSDDSVGSTGSTETEGAS